MAKRRRSPTKPPSERDPRRVAAGMLSCGQSAGGRARAAVLTRKQRSAIGKLGGLTAQANARRRREEEQRKLREEYPHIKPQEKRGRVRPIVSPVVTRTSVEKFLDSRNEYKTTRLNNAGLLSK